MEVAMPMSGTAIDCYEDMFKEITRKLYGEDGLPELGNVDRHNGPQDRGLTPIDYDVDTPLLKPEEHITAFGLAALMQNGFPPASILNTPFQQHKPNPHYEDKWIISEESLQWTQSKIASYNPAQKLYRCAECDCVGYLPRVIEHWLGTHSNLRAFQCPQCPYESAWVKCVRTHLSRQHNINSEETIDVLLKNNPVLQELTRYLQQLKTRLENNYTKTQPSVEEYTNISTTINNSSNRPTTTQPGLPSTESSGSTANKRYSCSYCPYATDRRDLFTRHENIHREEKPFQCYVCQKQFNRADHVKKHFLRMHREHPYDLNRIRRHPPKNASGMSYYQKYNSSGSQETSEQMNHGLGVSNSLAIPNGFSNVSRNVPNRPNGDVKNAKSNSSVKGSSKKKGEKRFTCCYCSWSGVDNWCLKRHMNTHLKPFVCGLCDYKAARSERLATHVLKVHNKRACSKCSYLADDPAQLTAHQQEHHPLDQRSNRSNNVLRNTSYSNVATSTSASFSISSQNSSALKNHELSAAAAILQHNNRLLQPETKPWKQHTPKQHGAARLFNYMEASDGSEPECDSRAAEDMSRVNLSHRIQSDFPEAGDVGSSFDDEEGEETELPLFVCPTCGCEFEDDGSLEMHQHVHRHTTTSPAKAEDIKENVNPRHNYKCQICNTTFLNQNMVMTHMNLHSSLSYTNSYQNMMQRENKRSRKQSQPKKVLTPLWENDGSLKYFQEKQISSNANGYLIDKYMAQLIVRKGYSCHRCKTNRISQIRKKSNLILHQYWRHSKKIFQCEHCNLSFRYRYQVVLHSSRAHIRRCKSKDRNSQIVPIKEPILSTVPVSDEPPAFLANSLATAVPEITNTTTNVHKLGMSFFDHTFLHSNSGINGHMPIIIPTFPPN